MNSQLKEDRRVNVMAFWPAFIGLVAFLLAGIFFQEELGAFLTASLYWMADYFGWYLNLLSLACLFITIWVATSKYGHIKIGGKDAKPEFTYFNWFAMTICGGIGTGLLFWAMGEPIYHFVTPPVAAGVEAYSREAAIFSVSQTMWQWSFVQYSIYTICAVAFTVAVYNRGQKLRYSSVIDPVFGNKHPWIETLIHGSLIFCMVGGVANSMGVGLMQIGGGLEVVFGIAQSNMVYFVVAACIGAFFIISCLSGIGKGLKYVSTFTITVFMGLLVYTLIFGDAQFIGKLGTEAVGEILNNWGSKTLINNTMTSDTWPADWIIQYWASFIVYAPVFGMFFCRMAKGRTIKEFVLMNVVVPSVFSMFWIAVFGGMTISLQSSGQLDIWEAIQTSGMQTVVFQIIGSMPLGGLVQVIFIIAIIGSFCTMADPLSAVLATMSVHGMTIEDEAPRKIKIVIGTTIAAMAYILVATGGITAVKSVYVLVGLPISLVLILCIVSAIKQLKSINEYEDGMLPDSTED